MNILGFHKDTETNEVMHIVSLGAAQRAFSSATIELLRGGWFGSRDFDEGLRLAWLFFLNRVLRTQQIGVLTPPVYEKPVGPQDSCRERFIRLACESLEHEGADFVAC